MVPLTSRAPWAPWASWVPRAPWVPWAPYMLFICSTQRSAIAIEDHLGHGFAKGSLSVMSIAQVCRPHPYLKDSKKNDPNNTLQLTAVTCAYRCIACNELRLLGYGY